MDVRTIIDEKGNVIEEQVVFAEGKPVDYVMRENHIAVDDVCNAGRTTTNGISHPYLKPVWTGTAWVESASEAELAAAYVPPVFGEPERIQALEDAVRALLAAR